MPLHELRRNPCLGFSNNGVNGLAGPLSEEFAPENLQLSPNELSQLSPVTVMDLGSVVYQRIRPYSAQVGARVLSTIKSQLANPSTTVTANTVVSGGGLGLSRSTVVAALRVSFFPLIRLRLANSDITPGITVGDITSQIVPKFTALNR